MTDEKIERSDTATPAYALRELANWIEHRSGDSQEIDGDATRIELGLAMADALDKLLEDQHSTIEALNTQVSELLRDRKAALRKVEELIAVLAIKGPVGDELIGADVPNDADSKTVTPFQVASTPARTIDDHQCETLTFDRDIMAGVTWVRCDQGRSTKIKQAALDRMVPGSPEVIMAMARQIAADHSCDLQQLYSKMRERSPNDLTTITLDTLSSPHQTQGGGGSKEA